MRVSTVATVSSYVTTSSTEACNSGDQTVTVVSIETTTYSIISVDGTDSSTEIVSTMYVEAVVDQTKVSTATVTSVYSTLSTAGLHCSYSTLVGGLVGGLLLGELGLCSSDYQYGGGEGLDECDGKEIGDATTVTVST
jgi:hypothetical protein